MVLPLPIDEIRRLARAVGGEEIQHNVNGKSIDFWLPNAPGVALTPGSTKKTRINVYYTTGKTGILNIDK